MSFSFPMVLIIAVVWLSLRIDNEGRYLILEEIIQDMRFVLINIYEPNKTSNQSSYFLALSELIPVEHKVKGAQNISLN